MLKRINPAGVHPPAPSYTQVVEDTRTGTVHVAGQVGLTVDGELAGPDMASQARQLLANLDAILAALELARADIARRQVFVTDMDEYFSAGADDAVTDYFRAAPSTSTLVQVSRLYRPEVRIEVEVTIVRPGQLLGSTAPPSGS